MASHVVLQFSPVKYRGTATVMSPLRLKQPSSEKFCLPYVTLLVPKNAALTSSSGSPSKKIKSREDETVEPGKRRCEIMSHNNPTDYGSGRNFEILLGSNDLTQDLAKSKKIQLAYELVDDRGRATCPPSGDFSDLFKIFPTTKAVEIFPPFLVFLVEKPPPTPRPFTIGGLPIRFCVSQSADPFNRGRLGRGPKCLKEIDLHRSSDYSEEVLKQALKVLRGLGIQMRDIFWFAGFWQVTIIAPTEIKLLPSFLGSSPVFYKTQAESAIPDPAALRSKAPHGVVYDDTMYTTTPNALLRPGIMLSSSLTQNAIDSTTSGILVVNEKGEIFVTVASHGFAADGLIWHPTPTTGKIIGRIVDTIPGTGISMARLNPGLRYVNETFGSHEEPNGIKINGLTPPSPPHLRAYDEVQMNNPFSGSSEGIVMALGATIPEEGNLEYVKHQWLLFENGDEPIEGSCGSPITDGEGRLVGLFRYMTKDSSMCLSLSASILRDFGYEICEGIQTFV